MTQTAAFKTSTGEAEYLAAYDATLRDLWPVPYEEIEVRSRFGTTHVITCGAEDAPPLVLLHGFMNTALIWAPNVADLSRDHRIYAIDIMGHPSKSIPDEPIGSKDALVEWLTATVDGLSLDHFDLAGISFGGWISLNFVVDSPDRVLKLVLLSPAASLQPLNKQFGLRAVLSGVIPTRRNMNSFMRWMGLEETPGDRLTGPLLDMIWLGGTHFQMAPETRRVMPTVFSDDELRSVDTPVLLLMGDNEVIYDSAKALDRASQLIPNLEGGLVLDSRHAMSFNRPQIVNPRIIEFLSGQ